MTGCFDTGSSSRAATGASKLDNGNGGGTYTSPASVAPVISGSPASVAYTSQLYSFVPNASDKEGDRLTFSVTNKPPWTNFDTTTGRLSGTPATTDVGLYAGIAISVSDGTSTASMDPFAVTVSAPTSGNAVISWQAPSQNTDGSALTNLRGFRIYYGRSAGALDRVVAIDSPNTTNYTLQGLSLNTWYFSMTAVNTDGVESARTNPVSKVVTG